jgi:hypothetical protein
MAQEIVRLCDPCLADDERVNASAVTVALNGKPLLLDLCEDHEALLIKPLRDVLAAFGQTVTAPTGAPKRAYTKRTPPSAAEPAGPAPAMPATEGHVHVCPFEHTGYAGASALLKHLDSVHGLRGIYAATGGVCPLCGVERPPSGAHSLAGHVRDEHGEPSLSRAVVAAEAIGDPHGVHARFLTAGHP